MDIQQYIESGRNLNTKKKTEQSIGLFKEYLNRQFILLAPQDQDHIDLNVNLCRFLITLKRKNGSEYEPVTVRSIVGGIARYLTEKKYANIMEHPDFKDMHAVLKRKMKELKDKGMGNGPRTASALTNEEVKSMWESGVFTLTTPLGLLRILFFYMSMNFGMRSGQEHRDLQWGDISLQRDHNDDEFLTYTERRTKTRSGENPKDRRKCVPQLWLSRTWKTRTQSRYTRSTQRRGQKRRRTKDRHSTSASSTERTTRERRPGIKLRQSAGTRCRLWWASRRPRRA